jgi:hypothetical protein
MHLLLRYTQSLQTATGCKRPVCAHRLSRLKDIAWRSAPVLGHRR